MSAFFMSVWMCEYVRTFTNPDGGIVKTIRLILHCIRTFRVTSTSIKYHIQVRFLDIEFDTTRTQLEYRLEAFESRFEYCSNPYFTKVLIHYFTSDGGVRYSGECKGDYHKDGFASATFIYNRTS